MIYQNEAVVEALIKERREHLLQEAARERLAKLARRDKANGGLAASTLVWAGTRLTRLGLQMQGAERAALSGSLEVLKS